MNATDDALFLEQYEIFQNDAQLKTPHRAAADLRRLGVSEDVLKRLIERFEHQVIVIAKLGRPSVVYDGQRMTWYTGPRPGDPNWPRLEERLRAKKWDKDNIEDLDLASTRVVSLLEHPQTDGFTTKGLVLGYVQSGKTTNYTSVLAKAADRGYRLFIVLAGIHNELRRQTQVRLVNDLVVPNPERWLQLTPPEHDFVPPANAAAFVSRHSDQAVLAVVKKNGAVLRKLIKWLDTAHQQLLEIPAIVIDDEADQAAVATPTINPLIRKLLEALPRVAYVGYTATPFANLLIDPANEDLYPRDFVVTLPKPAGHFGTEVIFGREVLDYEDPDAVDDGLDMIREVPVDEVPLVRPAGKSDVDGFSPSVAGELRQAVRWFLLATAARRVRGTGIPHSTMLIHTSVRVSVHESFKPVLDSELTRLRERLAVREPNLITELREQWDREAAKVPSHTVGEAPVAFDDMLEQLDHVANEVRVVLDNSRSEDRLDYTGDSVVAIAVGGNTLSRGLTLEGLVVSYFVRSVSAYDTLLQMGRWFGYRDGYADLPRIWMTDELRQWFRHIAGVEAEMRQDIERYMRGDETPMTLAVRIRSHPALRITGAAKMQDALKDGTAFGGRRVQTRYFRTADENWLLQNERAARLLVERLVGGSGEPETIGTSLLWRDTPVEDILSFLERYRFHDDSLESDAGLLDVYIRRRNERGTLLHWNVALMGSARAKVGDLDLGRGISALRVIRSKIASSGTERADIKTLMSRRDAGIDLDGLPPGTPSEDVIFRMRNEQLPDHGLLTIYAIDAKSEPQVKDRAPLDAVRDVIGAGFVFPQPEKDEAVFYKADLSRVIIDDGYVEEEDLTVLEEE